MNKLTTVATLSVAVLIASLAKSAWPNETFTGKFAAPAEQTPAAENRVTPNTYVQPRQQAPRWHVPQQFFGRMPIPYPPRVQFQPFPPRPATPPVVRQNPLGAALKQTQEQLTAKKSELLEARRLLEQLRGKLQDSLAAETRLTDKVTYSTHEQNALRIRITDLVKTLNAANATLEQQHQLLSDQQAFNQSLATERDQLRSKLARQDEQLNALQSQHQAAMQTLAQARVSADAAREALNRLEAVLGQQEKRLQGGRELMGSPLTSN